MRNFNMEQIWLPIGDVRFELWRHLAAETTSPLFKNGITRDS
jgi:hypothetical protein